MDQQDSIDGQQAGRVARQKTLEACEKLGLSIDHAVVTILKATKANLIRCYNHEGDIIYSRPLADHRTRLAAAELALTLYDAIPSQRHQVEHDISGNLMAAAAEVFRQMATAGHETPAITEEGGGE